MHNLELGTCYHQLKIPKSDRPNRRPGPFLVVIILIEEDLKRVKAQDQGFGFGTTTATRTGTGSGTRTTENWYSSRCNRKGWNICHDAIKTQHAPPDASINVIDARLCNDGLLADVYRWYQVVLHKSAVDQAWKSHGRMRERGRKPNI